MPIIEVKDVVGGYGAVPILTASTSPSSSPTSV